MIHNSDKKFFLKIASIAVEDVNLQTDAEWLTYSGKAMIRCGLAKQLNSLWEISQSFPHLQIIINKHRDHFDGFEPSNLRNSVYIYSIKKLMKPSSISLVTLAAFPVFPIGQCV